MSHRSMQHSFSHVPRAEIQRSSFDRSHIVKTTFNASELIPFYIDEVIPGDTFKCKCNLFCRTSTTLFPTMDNMYLETFFFFVPTRLVWTNWKYLMGQRDAVADITTPDTRSVPVLKPKVGATYFEFSPNDLGDYFGLPVSGGGSAWPTTVRYTTTDKISALPFRAYNLIWNEWFRDQNTQNAWVVPLDDGPDVYEGGNGQASLYALARRNRRHDYFWSCLPWPQKGVAVAAPLGGVANLVQYPSTTYVGTSYTYNGVAGTTQGVFPVKYFDTSMQSGPFSQAPMGAVYNIPSGISEYAHGTDGVSGMHAPGTVYQQYAASTSTVDYARVGAFISGRDLTDGSSVQIGQSHYHIPPLQVNLSSATGVSINDLRQAFQTQRMLERDARSGSRYTEILRAHFGVVSPDARLQRPEYLGGSSTRINVNPVMQTAPAASGQTKLGSLAGYGVGGDVFHGFTKSFVEHGYIIGICNVRAELAYQYGINKLWTRSTRYDFYWPALAHLGEQPVLEREIFSTGSFNDPVTDFTVFGYQERYAEYRYKPAQITGSFRSNSPISLDSWHYAEKIGSTYTPPLLNADWIEDYSMEAIDRTLSVNHTVSNQFLMDGFIQLECVRPMPVYSVPGMLDHF